MTVRANQTQNHSAIRDRLRSIPAVYFLYGILMRCVFETRAFIATAVWAASSKNQKHSPLPPPRLLHRVCGSFSAEDYLDSGRKDFKKLSNIFKCLEIRKNQPAKILDFGCGSSRTLRHFFELDSAWEYFGTDLDQEAVEWNQTNFHGQANWCANQVTPPTQFRDNNFDVIYAISIFTHLDEQLQRVWLQEFKRILKDDGTLIITVHGKAVWKDKKDWRQKVQSNGMYFMHTHKGIRNLTRTPSHYHTALHCRDYILATWSSIFPNIQYVDAESHNEHDYVILSRRGFSVVKNISSFI